MKQECRRYIKKGNAMNREIRNVAKALIIKDDKMLAIKISDGKEYRVYLGNEEIGDPEVTV